MTKSKSNPKVDACFTKAKKWREEMELMREIVLETGLTEELKWQQPCYTLDGSNVVLIGGFKEHCGLLFCRGALLKDPKKILKKPGEQTQSARRTEFTSVAEIVKLKSTLKAYLLEAIKVHKAGLEVEYKPITERKLPEELEKKLAGDRTFEKAFKALTPGRQRAYLVFFAAPKQSQTRMARIEKCTPQILKGKGLLDDFYEKRKKQAKHP